MEIFPDGQIHIKIPSKYSLTKELVSEIQLLNPEFIIGRTKGNILTLSESAFLFDDYRYIEIRFPTSIFPDSNFDRLYRINPSELNFEQPGNHSIILKKGVFCNVDQIFVQVSMSLFMWSNDNSAGRVYLGKAEYEFQRNNRKEVRMADISFMNFDRVAKDFIFKERILVAPNLAIEIVSTKYGLKLVLNRMQEVWMEFDSAVGLVICPFSKKLYIFDKDADSYREQSIYDPFAHPLLPGYTENFGQFLR
jgi:hypothetical protein